MIPKFRAWDKENKNMYKVSTLALTGVLNDEYVLIDTNGSFEWRSFNEVILMQSTGLHDKNGKEIFEGDILEIKGHPFQRHTGEMSGMPVGIDIDGRYVIEYNQENAGYVVGNWKTREVICYCTVIGNIHEHSHLLDNGGQ